MQSIKQWAERNRILDLNPVIALPTRERAEAFTVDRLTGNCGKRLRDAVVRFRSQAGTHPGEDHVTAEYRPCERCERSYIRQEELLDEAIRRFDEESTPESDGTEKARQCIDKLLAVQTHNNNSLGEYEQGVAEALCFCIAQIAERFNLSTPESDRTGGQMRSSHHEKCPMRMGGDWCDCDRWWNLEAAFDRMRMEEIKIDIIRKDAARRCAEIAKAVMTEPDSPHGVGWEESAERIHNLICDEFALTTPKSDSTNSTTHENPKSDKLTSCQTDLD